MSEDSLALDFISCRSEACAAPLLPPRKRLLAGLKNGWSSPSSSSCAAASMEDVQVTETLAHTALEEDQNSVEVEDRVSSRSLPNADAESMDSPRKSQRQSKRLDSSPMKKYSKRNKHASVSGNGSAAKTLFVDGKEFSVSEAANVEEGMDAVTGEAESGQQRSMDFKEGEGGAESTVLSVDPKLASSPSFKEVANHGSEELCESTREPAGVSKGEEESVGLKSRRNTTRHHQSRNKTVQHKQDRRHNMSSHTSLPLDDEEFARQLHRAINSSPRISRRQSLKENGTTFSRSPKHHQGS